MFLKNYKPIIKLHLIIFILGFTAILGKLISISSIELVAYRMLIAASVLLIFLKIKKVNFSLPKKIIVKIFLVGLIVAVHWILFFQSIKLSNVSVALGCFSSITLFTSFLEPIFYKRKIRTLEVILGLITIAGLYLIFQFETRYTKGIIYALLSALTGSLFLVFNGNLTKYHSALSISFYEMLGGFIGICCYLLINNFPDLTFHFLLSDLFYLLILGIICTAYAFMKTIDLMKILSPYHISLTLNLEPVYGIIFALLIFGESEKMTVGFYIGTLVILMAVFLYPAGKKYFYGTNHEQ